MPVTHKSLREMSDKEALERIQGDVEKAKSAKSQDMIRAKRYRNIYQALDPPDVSIDETTGMSEDDKDIYSNTYMPIGAALVDSTVTKIYNHFFSTEDYFEIAAKEFEDDDLALRVTAHMKQRHREMMFRYKIFLTLQIMSCFDYSVTMARWLTRPGYENRRVTKQYNKMFGGIPFPYQETTIEPTWVWDYIDRPDIVVFDYFNSWHDASARNGLEDSKFFIDERDESIETLKMLAKTKDRWWGKYKNVSAVVKASMEAEKSIQGSYDPVDRKDNERSVRITRYWTHDHVVEYAHGKMLSRTDLTGLPLQLWKLYELPSEFKGMGLLQRIERNQSDINASINSIRDFQNLITNPIAAVDAELASAEDGEVRLHPGKILTFSGGQAKDKIQFFQPGVDMTSNTLQHINMQFNMTRAVSRVSENDSGQYTSGRRTATEAREVAEGSDSSIFNVASRLELTALESFYRYQFMLEQIFMTKEEQFRYYGEKAGEFVIVRPEDYRWAHVPRFFARGSAYRFYNDVKTQQFLAAMDRALMAPQFNNLEAIYTKMWQLLDPRDYQQFIRDPRDKTHNVPPNMENMLLAQGHEIEVSPENDHQVHMQVHQDIMQTPDYNVWPDMFKMRMQEHIAEHQQAMNTALSSGNGGGGRTNALQQQDSADSLRGIRGPSLGVTQ